MSTVEKFITVSALVVAIGLIATNPSGTAAAGIAGSNFVTAWLKGLYGKG